MSVWLVALFLTFLGAILIGFIFPVWYFSGDSGSNFSPSACVSSSGLGEARGCILQILQQEECCTNTKECTALLDAVEACPEQTLTSCINTLFSEKTGTCVSNVKSDVTTCACNGKVKNNWLSLSTCNKECLNIYCREAYQENFKILCD